MAQNSETFPVMKNGEFLGYADAAQIARSKGKLEIFDEAKAERLKAESKVDAAKKVEAKKVDSVAKAIKAGGADASAIKKGPSK